MVGGGAALGRRPDPVPPVAPVRPGDRRQRASPTATTRRRPPAARRAARRAERTTNPQAGVWEVSVDTRRTSDADNAPFTLTAIDPRRERSARTPTSIPSATIGVPVARSYTLTNLFGAFTGRAVGTALGSARIAPSTIANLEQQQYDVDDHRPARRRSARRSAARPIRPPTSTCSSSTARPGPASSPARPPTATPRSR